MQSVDIRPSEWRWVILVSAILIFLSVIPFFVVVSGTGDPSVQFMGAVHGYQAAAVDLAHVTESAQGRFLVHWLHTGEPHPGSLTDGLHVFAGMLARFLNVEPIILYQVTRVGASLFMYMALYYFGASIWTRLRARQVFFGLVSIAGGLGWLLAVLTDLRGYPDLSLTGFFPYQTTLFSANLSFAIGALAILAASLVAASTVSRRAAPSVDNQGLTVLLFSTLLSLVYPVALLPVLVAFLGLMLAHLITNRKSLGRDMRWMLWSGVPSLPLIAFYVLALLYNPVAQELWLQQNLVAPPELLPLLGGLGLPLLIAIPGIWRAVRRFESDGNQFMIGWLAAMLILMYVSPVIRVNFGIGLMIPIAYFATRAVEDVWLDRIPRTWRSRVFAAFVPVLAASHLAMTLLPLGRAELYAPGTVTLERDYLTAFRWLAATPERDAVVLAAPNVSVWLPSWTARRVVYAGPRVTLNPAEKRRAVENWYGADDSGTFNCTALLNGAGARFAGYQVTYVLDGPQERALGDSACIELLEPVASFGAVNIYSYSTNPGRE
ncbi:MAG TPA: hypothetical protein PKX07_05865 [Aggregatilineales bacterium]|nr:hypothetical protein [Aggregatilineales bacterium]